MYVCVLDIVIRSLEWREEVSEVPDMFRKKIKNSEMYTHWAYQWEIWLREAEGSKPSAFLRYDR